MNKYLLYALLMALGLMVTVWNHFNYIGINQKTIIKKMDYRFKSYDFEYFARYNYVLPNKTKTRGKLCLDLDYKEEFYKDKDKTPFYKFMDKLECNPITKGISNVASK